MGCRWMDFCPASAVTDNQGRTCSIADAQIPERRSIAERILRENGGRRAAGRVIYPCLTII